LVAKTLTLEIKTGINFWPAKEKECRKPNPSGIGDSNKQALACLVTR